MPVKVTCEVCTTEKIVKTSRAREFHFCSRKCFSIGSTGHPPTNWKGGKMQHRGYVLILKKDHPEADRDGYVPEHRLVMENHLGRFLTSEEVVHHKNHKRSDNRIENLELVANQSEHMQKHYPRGAAFSSRTYVRDEKGRVTGVI